MTITTDWIDSFKDPAMQKPLGKGAFFSGVVLGFIASCQVGKGGSLSSAPLFKKLSFGKLKKRELKQQLSQVPMLINIYDVPYSWQITELANLASEALLQATEELGVDGNFIFSTAFLNAWNYLYQLYPQLKSTEKKDEEATK